MENSAKRRRRFRGCPHCQMSLEDCVLMSRCPRIPCCSDVGRCSSSNIDVDHLQLVLQLINHLQSIKKPQGRNQRVGNPPAVPGFSSPACRRDGCSRLSVVASQTSYSLVHPLPSENSRQCFAKAPFSPKFIQNVPLLYHTVKSSGLEVQNYFHI